MKLICVVRDVSGLAKTMASVPWCTGGVIVCAPGIEVVDDCPGWVVVLRGTNPPLGAHFQHGLDRLRWAPSLQKDNVVLLEAGEEWQGDEPDMGEGVDAVSVRIGSPSNRRIESRVFRIDAIVHIASSPLLAVQLVRPLVRHSAACVRQRIFSMEDLETEAEMLSKEGDRECRFLAAEMLYAVGNPLARELYGDLTEGVEDEFAYWAMLRLDTYVYIAIAISILPNRVEAYVCFARRMRLDGNPIGAYGMACAALEAAHRPQVGYQLDELALRDAEDELALAALECGLHAEALFHGAKAAQLEPCQRLLKNVSVYRATLDTAHDTERPAAPATDATELSPTP